MLAGKDGGQIAKKTHVSSTYTVGGNSLYLALPSSNSQYLSSYHSASVDLPLIYLSIYAMNNFNSYHASECGLNFYITKDNM